ncbi:AgmX/PglI C-terminal domain-containing protein [Sandaracinus amylolyticus]|uniref:Putative abductin-like protein n=1 Tax=Sandaracinus amylolyticus TaxID=927083 RepID=A0A0F6WAT4_9BACT|nr:AgmX/PglI C-terminal domain-containing protein [Sandaracinus amylolyticus]AKF11715.1 Putative abductin-like protein [Sandaracinus amylolyticus]
MRRHHVVIVGVVALALVACGHRTEAVDATVATLRTVRGDVRAGEDVAGPRARVAPGAIVTTGEASRARLELDGGGALLLDQGARLTVAAEDAIAIDAGRVYLRAHPGDAVAITIGEAALRAADAALSIEPTRVYVVRGEISYRVGAHRGVIRAGEEMALGATSSGPPAITPATLWSDWTGGLVRPGPDGGDVAPGMGMLEARVPDEIGVARWALTIRRLDVRVRVDGDLAITEVEQEFFNPASETVEGLYRVSVPEGAVLQRFAVDRDGTMVEGYVREQQQARVAYEAQVYRGSTDDPALLEWDAAGRYRARIYPIAPGEVRRIAIRYAEWLGAAREGGPRLYRYPMGAGDRAPHVQEMSFVADLARAGAPHVRAGMGAVVEGDSVVLRRSDFRPRSDLWLELTSDESGRAQRAYRARHEPPPRAPGSRAIVHEADERDYWFLPLRLPARLTERTSEGGIDLVVVADVSAATDRSHLELGRSVVESIAAHLGPRDRLSIVGADLAIRPLIEGEGATALGPASGERVEALLEGLSRVPAGGATDLGAAIAEAAALLDPARPGAVVYVGDGAPTVGELGAEQLLEHFARLPHPVRLYAIGVGSSASRSPGAHCATAREANASDGPLGAVGCSNLDLLDALTQGGGLALRVEERGQSAEAALDVLAHAQRPLLSRVTVELGTGIDNVFPRRPVDLTSGDVLAIVGRVRDDPPSEIVVRGEVAGAPFEERIAVSTETRAETVDLRLRWAGERLHQLLLGGASREEIAELGTRYGLITPFTSYYVPSARELREMGQLSRLLRHEPLVDPSVAAEESTLAQIALGIALGPLALTGCTTSAEPPTGSSATSDPGALEEVEESPPPQQPGATETATSTQTESARYGVEGNGASAAVPLGQERVDAPQPAPAPPPATTAPVLPAEPEAAAAPVTGATTDRAPARRAEPSPDEIRSQLDALGYAPADGYGGLGIRGTGRGGGGSGEGTIGLGNLGAMGHGAGDGTGQGYGSGAGGSSGRRAAVPQVRFGQAEVRGALSSEVIRRVVRRHVNEVRFCYEQELAARPDLEGRVTVGFVIGATGAVQGAGVTDSSLGNPRVEGCIAQAVRRWTFPSPDGGGVVAVTYPFVLESSGGSGAYIQPTSTTTRTTTTIIVTTTTADDHARRRCSDAASRSLDDRRALWRERLEQASGTWGWVDVYRTAIRDCETPGWRDRRALLSLMLARAGSLATMIELYQQMTEGSARGYLRGEILRRVRSPEDLRLVRNAFGLSGGVDWSLVEQVLARATTPAARLRALRELVAQRPDSLDLQLRLLEELEHQQRMPEAFRLASTMRLDPLADAGVRTAIGEMYLRHDREPDARRAFSEIVEFAPLDELARRRLGDLYRAHGWYDDAYRQYATLSAIRPDDPGVLLLLAQAAAGAGRVDEALRLEQRLMETAEPGAREGLARIAQLWSSVRFAKLREDARRNADEARLASLVARMRRSGVLRGAGDMRVSLTWSHPDAQLALWAAHPGLSPTRPEDLAPELGIEAFDVAEQESGPYRIEVRRSSRDRLGAIEGELVVVWHEGRPDERIQVIPLRFDAERRAMAWTITGTNIAETTPLETTTLATRGNR